MNILDTADLVAGDQVDATLPAQAGLPEFVGRYRVERIVGRGSFALVVLARDEELESAVALKILRARNSDTETRFLEEARMQRRIQSLNVISVRDIGRLTDGSPYLVLDYASRGTLEDRLNAGAGGTHLVTDHRLQLLSFVDDLADGLLAIHRAGMVHRDIKPANILFCKRQHDITHYEQHGIGADATLESSSTPDNLLPNLLANGERVLVGDLGIAKDLSKCNDSTTLLGGTPFYLAPEQRQADQPISPSADIYSATAVLWRALVNERPPACEDVDSKLSDLPETLIPQGWQQLFRKGLSANPSDRYQSADEWRWSIHDVLGSGSSTVVYRSKAPMAARTDICPYKGLAAYEAGDAIFFRGRDALVDQLCRRLQLESVLVVGGPSGSGKSSLVRAGLVTSLRAGALPGSKQWQSLLMTPGTNPMQALQECLESAGGLPGLLHRKEFAQSEKREKSENTTLVLIIDQFEEIFTLSEAHTKAKFLQTLSQLVGAASQLVKLVFVVRADFYAECAREPWLAAKITSNQVLVGPMTASELRRAITEPATEAGYDLEKGLVHTIIQEAGEETGSLPLVAHALVETWVRRSNNTLTLEGFKASGGVAGAISQSADATYEHELDEAGRQAARRLMLMLVNPGEGTPDTRRVVNREDIQQLEDGSQESSHFSDVIKKLTAARLLSVDDRKLQIAHETLLSSWPRLRQWIDDSRDDLRVRKRISLHAEEWQSEEQPIDLLYHGVRLSSAIEWLGKNSDQAGALEKTFLDSSLQRQMNIEEREKNVRRRSRRTWAIVIASLTLLTIAATASSIFAFRALQDSLENARIAEHATGQANFRFAGALGAAAYGHYTEDPRLALVLATEALATTSLFESGQSSTFDTRAALISARQTLASGGPFLLGSPMVAGDALSIAINPQGSILSVGKLNGEIVFFDVVTREELQPVSQDHSGGVRDMEFSPDGKSMVSAGVDGRLLLWQRDANGVWASKKIAETGDVLPDVDFHPSGDIVVTANHDASVGVWYLAKQGNGASHFYAGTAEVNAVAISQDGRYIVAGNADKTITAWDIDTHELVMGPLSGIHSSHLLDIEFSPSADSVFTMTTDGESKMLSFPDGEVMGTLFESSNEAIGALLVNHTRGELIGGNNRGELAIWDIESGGTVQRSASGHSQVVKFATMTSDERLIATLGRDQLIRFWTINDHFPMGNQLQVNSRPAKSVAISPDGSLLASGDKEGNIKLWRLDTNDAPKNLAGHQGEVWSLAFSSDGRLLASADRLGRLQVWDVKHRRVVQIIETGSEAIWSAEFVKNDKELVLATEAQVASYSVDGGQLLESWGDTGTPITRLALSPDRSKLIVAYANGDVVIESVFGDSGRKIFNTGEDLLWSAALNQSGTLLAAASSDETVSLFDVDSGERISKLTGHQGGATNVTFLQDGSTLVVSDRRGSIHWWDIISERRLAAPWRGHKKSAWRMALHPDGNRVATAGDDGKVWIWDALSADRACDIGYSAFDANQKNHYLGDEHTMRACQ